MTPDQRRDVVLPDLIADEGLRLRVYQDSLGILTIGIGRNLRDKGITKDEAFLLVNNDLDECESDLHSFGWFSALDPVRQGALMNLRFNLGPSRLRLFVKMLDAFERGDYRAAAIELGTSQWAQQVQPSRVDRLVRQLRTG